MKKFIHEDFLLQNEYSRKLYHEYAEKQPLSVYLSTINANEVGLAFAIATIYMVPCLLLFLHGEDYLVEGIAHQGSVKG